MYIQYYVKLVFICLSGRQYNDKGKLEEWWDPLTVSSFNKTANCMIDQYDSYNVDGISVSLNMHCLLID